MPLATAPPIPAEDVVHIRVVYRPLGDRTATQEMTLEVFECPGKGLYYSKAKAVTADGKYTSMHHCELIDNPSVLWVNEFLKTHHETMVLHHQVVVLVMNLTQRYSFSFGPHVDAPPPPDVVPGWHASESCDRAVVDVCAAIPPGETGEDLAIANVCAAVPPGGFMQDVPSFDALGSAMRSTEYAGPNAALPLLLPPPLPTPPPPPALPTKERVMRQTPLQAKKKHFKHRQPKVEVNAPDVEADAAPSTKISLDKLRSVFYLPIVEAAKHLGVCVTIVKLNCRRHGISRWPSRRINALAKSYQKMKSRSEGGTAPQPPTEAAEGILSSSQVQLFEDEFKGIFRNSSLDAEDDQHLPPCGFSDALSHGHTV